MAGVPAYGGLAMKLKLTADAEAVEIEYDELKAQIRDGKVCRQSLLQCDLLTKGEWRPLDDLQIYHKHSPEEHPPGERLAARLEREKSQDQDMMSDEEAQRWVDALEADHRSSVEASLGLVELSQVVRSRGVLGVTRLTVFPTFVFDHVFTFVFSGLSMRIEAAVDTGPPRRTPEGTLASRTRAVATLEIEDSPKRVATWHTFRSAVRRAGDYEPPLERMALDGNTYRHQVRDHQIDVDVKWTDFLDGPQAELLDTYRNWVEQAGLGRYWLA